MPTNQTMEALRSDLALNIKKIRNESPRILWRLKSLRGLSHEEIKQVFTRGSGTRSAHGAGAPRRVPFAVGGH